MKPPYRPWKPKGPGKGNRTTHHRPAQLAARRRFPPVVTPRRASAPLPDACFEPLPASKATKRLSMRGRRRT